MSTSLNTLLIVIDSARYNNPYSVFDTIRDTVKQFGGREYTEVRSPSIWSLPSHVAFLSGISPSEHGVMRNTDSVRDDVSLLYDELPGESGVFSTNPFLEDSEYGLTSQFDHRVHEPDLSTEGLLSHSKEVVERLFRDRHIMNHLKTWIGSQDEQSWNALVNLMDVHTPYIPETMKYSNTRDVFFEKNTRYNGDFDVPSSQLSVKQSLYCDCLLSVSNRINSIITYLEDVGELQNTHIVVTSDHGEGFGESTPFHDRDSVYHYNSVGEELLHVPMFEIHPDMTEFERVDSLGSVTNLYGLFTGELDSVCCEETTASVVFGGNLFSEKPFSGEVGNVLYRERDDGKIEKFVVSGGGTVWSTTDDSDEDVRDLVMSSVENDDENDISTSGAISSVTEDRLNDLGYI